jgi:hypothetical protein
MGTACTDPTPTGLVVIARDATGQIVTCITSHRDLVGAMHTGRCVLKLKPDAVRVEVHHAVSLRSDYLSLPLAAISRDDVPMEQIR